MQGSNNTVNLGPNWAVVQAFLVAFGRDIAMFLRLLPPRVAEVCRQVQGVLAGGKFTTYDEVDAWKPHDWWLDVENALVKLTGHWWHLAEVGRESHRVAFGFDAVASWIVRRWFFRFFTDPVTGYKNVGRISTRYQLLKRMVFVQSARKGEGCICMVHNRALLDPIKDFGSFRFICGFGDGVPLLWGQKKLRSAELIVLAVTPLEMLERWAPVNEVAVAENALFVNGVRYARVVYVRPDENGIVTDTSKRSSTPQDGMVPVWVVEKDFTTPCAVCTTKDGNPTGHPLMSAGQLWQHSTPLLATIVQVFWKPSRIARLFGRVYRAAEEQERDFARGLAQEVALTTAKHETAEERAGREHLQKMLERRSPTRRAALMLSRKEFTPLRGDWVILQLDVKGYTGLTRDWPSGTVSQMMKGLFQSFVGAAKRVGAWEYKRMGDLSILVFGTNWPRDADEPCPWNGDIQHAGQTAVKLATELHMIAQSGGVLLRIGIAVGDVTWSDQGDAPEDAMLEGIGVGLNQAARLESYGAKPGTTAVSPALMELVHGTEAGNPSKGTRLHGFEYIGGVPEKDGKTIPVWRRPEVEDTSANLPFPSMPEMPATAAPNSVFPDEEQDVMASGPAPLTRPNLRVLNGGGEEEDQS